MKKPKNYLYKGGSIVATLSVFEFRAPDAAEQALKSLLELQKQQLIVINDAAIVTWPEGKKKPKTYQAVNTGVAGALGGAFWGMLFGFLFFIPFLGMAMGAVLGGLTGKLRDYGIDDTFIKKIRDDITEGTSALFLMTSNEVGDKVVDEMKTWPTFEIVSTNLSVEQEEKLRLEFGEG
jgi:uncharacterized membrane protein